MPERTIVSPAQLNDWLTSEIRKVDGCHGCELTWKYRVRHPEQHGGCNWSELNLRVEEGSDLHAAAKVAAEIGARAFEHFNLEDELPRPVHPVADVNVAMARRMLYLPVLQLDANLINAKQKLEAVNQLEKWRDDGVICLAMSGVAHAEAKSGAGSNAEARKKKAATHIFTINERGYAKEDDAYENVEKILWGKAADDSQANDIEVVCEAIKYHSILITNDGGSKTQPGGILGNRDKLNQQFGVVIYRPAEAVEFIRSKISERDEFNAQVAELTGGGVPEWTGQD